MTQILAIIGIIGGLICAAADCLLDLKGWDNKKLGSLKIIDSKWQSMAHSRFVWSGILVMIAVPMYSCGFIALMLQLYKSNEGLAIGMAILFLCGAMGGFMIHTFLCITPTIYKHIMEKDDFDLAETVIHSIFRQISVPFGILYSLLVIIPSIMIVILILNGAIALPIWCIILNPLVFQLFGLLLRATKCKLFIDAPSICAASLGLTMYGVLALMLI